ncbi:MAG: hypothetical protein EPN30_10815 [Actinomycetota bacterium]|nr:MAG: hypothetical protein EPN30_10815 [Actinomycetota bacterium]
MNRLALEQLFKLQEVDTRLHELRTKLASLVETSGQKAVAGDVRALLQSQKVMNSKMETLVSRRDELDEHSRALMAKVKNIRAKEMSGAISHRDFASTEAEISHLEAQRAELDDAEFEVFSQIELLESQTQDLEQSLSQKNTQLSELKQMNSGVANGLNAEIASLEDRRSELLGLIDVDLEKIYEEIHARVGSMTIARVENGNCQGCRLKLSSVEIEGVKRTLAHEFSRPPTCEQCGRILFI